MNRKIPLWLVKRYYKIHSRGSEYEYECVLCGAIVDKKHRYTHLRFEHPLIWAKIEIKAKEWRKEWRGDDEKE